MTEDQRKQLNRFFVKTFNSILLWEDHALAESGVKNLSVKEMHVIETVIRMEPDAANTMSQIADQLNITVGALTTAVNTLVQKNYLRRQSDPTDRRLVFVYATESGLEVNLLHDQFHKQMLDYVSEEISESELEPLTRSLEQLSLFFESLAAKETRRK